MSRLLQIAQLGHPVLREQAREVLNLQERDIQELIDDMIATTLDVNGVGLAAPQVYHSKRIVIIASHATPRYPYAPEMEPLAMINPVVLETSSETVSDWEGCLSIPGIRAMVPRARNLRVRFLTREGKPEEKTYEDFVARIILHECDHLDGLTFFERIESTKDIFTEKEFLKALSK